MPDEQALSDGPLIFEEREPGLGVVTMNRPDKLNAINEDLLEAFERLFLMLEHSDSVRVIILTGSGRGFCAGADLTAAAGMTQNEAFSSAEKFLGLVQERFGALVLKLRQIPQPVIAAVNGPAAGGGMALALASDVRIVDPSAYFVASFINIGLSAGEMGASYLLPRLVGMSRASEILFTGRKVYADEAAAIGLAIATGEGENPAEKAVGIARVMLQKSPGGLAITKKVLDGNAVAPSLQMAVDMENRNQTILAVSSPFFQAIQQFAKG